MRSVNEMNVTKDYPVVMHNDLIKGKSNLSLNEIKLLRLAIMQVVKEDNDLKTYQISVQELAKLLNINSVGIYQAIDEITTDLLKELVYIQDSTKNRWKKFQWVSCCEYDNGIITIRLHDNLKPYLLGLTELYTKYTLEDILYLKSVNSIRLYELIREEMRYQKVYANKEANIYLSVDLIRQATNTENKYEKFSMFRARIVDAAIKEINEKLNYYISYQVVKHSRKIIGFNFNIKSKAYKRMLEKGKENG